jgi:hypothetical protein
MLISNKLTWAEQFKELLENSEWFDETTSPHTMYTFEDCLFKLVSELTTRMQLNYINQFESYCRKAAISMAGYNELVSGEAQDQVDAIHKKIEKIVAIKSTVEADVINEEANTYNSDYCINSSKLTKADLLRILNAMVMSGMFERKDGKKLRKNLLIDSIGHFFNEDLGKFELDLSQAYKGVESSTKIFDRLKEITIKEVTVRKERKEKKEI